VQSTPPLCHFSGCGSGSAVDSDSSAVQVVGDSGTIATVVLARSSTALAMEPTSARDGPHRLVLVTCEGYDPATGEYASNVVVTMKPAAP